MKKRKGNRRYKKNAHVKQVGRTSYYTHGYAFDPQTEQGIQGAYGSQGQESINNSYKRS